MLAPLLNKVSISDDGVVVSLAVVAFAVKAGQTNFCYKAQCTDITKLGKCIAPELNKVVRHVAAGCTLLALGQA